MNCPSCGIELSRTWKTLPVQRLADVPTLQWRCGTCGGFFTNAEVKLFERKRVARFRQAWTAEARSGRRAYLAEEKNPQQPKQRDS